MSEHFPYRGDRLFAEDVPVAEIAAAVGTPFYLYSVGALQARYRNFVGAFRPQRPLVCYAVKANSNLAVLRVFAGLGAGADVVSEGELRRALAAGIPRERIVFSGNGKTAMELEAALAADIRQINVESISELRRLSDIALVRRQTARVAIRINPDVDALTHAKLTTGKKESKFGIDIAAAAQAYALAAELPGIEPVGLAVHIGSQMTETGPYRAAFERMSELVLELRTLGHDVRSLDLGGGLGIRYHAETPIEPAAYAALVRETVGGLGLELAFEPGRFLCGPAGLLVARVVYVKDGASRRFVIVDAAMNDLIRPAMYNAWHDVVPADLPTSGAVAPADVVGPVCEPGDTFAIARDLPELSEGDLVALTNAGAYGAVMSSTYNSRLLVPEVLVAGDRFAVVRPRPTYEQLLAADKIPDWLNEAADTAAQPPVRKRGAA